MTVKVVLPETIVQTCNIPLSTASRHPPARSPFRALFPEGCGLRHAARLCIEERDLDRKVERTDAAWAAWSAGHLPLETETELPGEGPVDPGLPARLELTPPTRVKRRGFGTEAGLVAFVHAIAHIEWNAINLAWDAVWRFGAMPRAFHDDWARVAFEEASHFAMLRRRLLELGSDYGLLPAHDGLWQTAEATRHDVLDRMALVPRVLEARGLDVTPGMIARLRARGDEATAAILTVVLREEVGHVRVGSSWFHQLCDERGLAPAATFEAAIRRHFRGRPHPVVDPALRRQRTEAGFRDDELDALDRLAADHPTPAA